jgi:hypothetical protein
LIDLRCVEEDGKKVAIDVSGFPSVARTGNPVDEYSEVQDRVACDSSVMNEVEAGVPSLDGLCDGKCRVGRLCHLLILTLSAHKKQI